MPTLTGCTKCRTVVPPGQPACLRCGHAVDVPIRVCVACEHRNDSDSRFCAQCGRSLARPASPLAPVLTTTDTTGVLLDSRTRPTPFLVAAAIFVALGVVVAGLQVVDHRFFAPARTVSSFFAALADRDAAAASRLLVSDEAGPMLRSTVLESDGYAPPSAARIEHTETAGDQATIRVSFLLDAQRRTLELHLLRDRHATAGLFQRWRIDDGVYGLEIAADEVSSFLVAGQPIDIGAEGATGNLLAFPGGYRVSLPDQPLWTATPVMAYAGVASSVPATLEPTVKESARATVDDKIRAYLGRCAKSLVVNPAGCPFSTYAYGEVRGVRWQITKYPEYKLDKRYDGQLAVSTTTPGEAQATGEELSYYGGGTAPFHATSSFYVSGEVGLSGGEITFQPTDLD